MKRRDLKGPSKDLLVCFPTRSHLTLMPKTICSPSRCSKTDNHRGKYNDGGFWSKSNQMGSDQISEPTSPKVTCAGQIKARPKSRPCKNWQSVMEEIERLHNHNNNNKKYMKKPSWSDALGFKKESMQFLTCLRSFKFDLGCFSAFPNANVTSDDDDDDGDGNNDNNEEINHVKTQMGVERYDLDEDFEERSSKSAISKWFMFLEENQDFGLHSKEEFEKSKYSNHNSNDLDQVPCIPPSNALLLMRCRSAPTKSLLKDKKEDENVDANDEEREDNDDEDDNHKDEQYNDGKKRENLMELMNYEGDFYKLSCDIAKETWVVAGIKKDQCLKTQNSQRSSTECLQEVKACLQ